MSKTFPARRAAVAALIGLLAGLSLPALGQVHKCTQADGSIAFQASPCGADAPAPERVTAAQLNAAQRARERAQARAASSAHASSAHSPSGTPASRALPCRKTPATPRAASAPARSSSASKPC